jgi:hypothetical protein
VSAQIIPLRQQIVRSHDLLDLGEALAIAGSIMASAGRHVMQLHELPTDLILTEAAAAGQAILDCVHVLRQAGAVQLPADCEAE